MIKSSCAIAVFIFGTQVVQASTLTDLRGKWAFDDSQPASTKCLEIDALFLKKFEKTQILCMQNTSGGYAETNSQVYQCTGKKFNRMVLDNKKACEENLQTELANGD